MVQLWVNLPAKDKMTAPHYQAILDAQIPSVDLAEGKGRVRVIAGEFAGVKGPARTFTAMNVLDIRLNSDTPVNLAVADGWTTALVVLKGSLNLAGTSETIGAAEVAIFERAGNSIIIENADNVSALLLCGEPIEEPIVGSGPFVMNTAEEIRQAISDYQSGKMGHLN